MGNIVLLDDLTINKIAAGEVIERPASVVKELVENSIDAGATNINVEIKNGGISYIRVTDNGKGIMPDDMEIAFERHATSKIRVAEDLEVVRSMGFRGEALASIAAIAKVAMKSKTMNEETGYEIIVEGGNVLQKQEAGCPNGTTIVIENLFYNTPVRYKFLKKDFTESGYIEDVITRIALIHPEIAIKLISSGKTIIQTSGNGNIKNVVYGIYGKEIAENILEVSYAYEDIKVTGVVGKPIISRSNRSNQLFFVNQRYIKDRTLSSSAEQAFKGMITIGKFGFLILNIELNPQKVDVNVHPAKLEVRFEEEQKVFKAVYHAIKDTLLKNDLVSNPETIKEQLEEKEKTEEKEENAEVKIEEEKVEQSEEKTGLFQKKSDKNEEEPNILEQIYIQRSSTKLKEDYASYFNNIMDKMAEMKKTVEDFKKTENATTNEIENKNLENNQMLDIMLADKKELTNIQHNMPQIPENENNIENTQTINTKQIENKLEENTKVLENIDMPEENDETIVITEEMKQELTQNMEIEETENLFINENTEDKDSMPNEEFEEMYSSIFGKTYVSESKVEEEQEEYKVPEPQMTTGENISIFNNEEGKYSLPSYKFIGIAFSTYIIIELDKELYIIDQHAAHERIMYEKIKENYYRDDNKDSQLMLLPDIITLTHKEMDIARENMQMFEKAGFMLEEFGDNTIRLTGVPNVCLELDTKELFLETLDEINTVARTAKQEIEEKFIATVACKAAVKANMALTKEEVDSLMEKLLVLPNPFTCPHGRPTAIKMTKTDIEKKFSRR